MRAETFHTGFGLPKVPAMATQNDMYITTYIVDGNRLSSFGHPNHEPNPNLEHQNPKEIEF